MKDEHSFERIREDVETSQKAVLWEDALKGGKSVDAFLWNGAPNAKPIQRAGLVVFALLFLLPAVLLIATPFAKRFEDGSAICLFLAAVPLLISARLLRNVFLLPPKPSDVDERSR
jgi:hypothetical protein